MLRKIRQRPLLMLICVAALLVLIFVVAVPLVPHTRGTVTASSVAGNAQAPGTPTAQLPARHVFPSSPNVTAHWSDSTALVSWKAMAGASQYVVSLIRNRDLGIMERQTVPASQRMFDAQGVWPGEMYQVAVQPITANGAVGAPSYSAPGQAVPISRKTYNGFLDTENVVEGQIDPNLWDEHIYYSDGSKYGAFFVNNQMHYHIAAGCPGNTPCSGDQTVSDQNARVPIDWTGRVATIHGEVDLKGDFHQWFGVALTPQIIGPDRILDEVDRTYSPVSMPQLELFDFQGALRLIYAASGHVFQELATYPNPIGLNNVRDDIVWKVSNTHTTVVIDGKTAFDLDWPAPLSFSHAYLTLFAEDYPTSGGTNGQPACDDFPHDCSIWHIDNWGFDSATGNQPQVAAYFEQGCASYHGNTDVGLPSHDCGGATFDNGGSGSVVVPHVRTDGVVAANVVLDAQQLDGTLQVSVNGAKPVKVPYIATDRNIYNTQSYLVQIPASALKSGSNRVTFSLSGNTAGAVSISNVQIEAMLSTPYVAPQLPAEPAPGGYWTTST